MSSEKWIQKALPKSSHGKLHRALNVPMDKKIPEGKIKAAEHSKNPRLRKEADLAMTLSKFHK